MKEADHEECYVGSVVNQKVAGRTCSEPGDASEAHEGLASYGSQPEILTLMPSRIEAAWDRARLQLQRVTPLQAAEEVEGGALLIDTRTETQRRRDGRVPGAKVVDRTVLEWRLDPTSPWRIPEARAADQRMILICAEGYSSVFAALSLRSLGMRMVTDVDGGFHAWKAAGLPVASGD